MASRYATRKRSFSPESRVKPLRDSNIALLSEYDRFFEESVASHPESKRLQ